MRTSFRAQERLDHRRDSRARDRAAQPACACRSPLHCAQQGRNSGRRAGNANMGQPIGLQTPGLHRAGKAKRVRPAKWALAFNSVDAEVSRSRLVARRWGLVEPWRYPTSTAQQTITTRIRTRAQRADGYTTRTTTQTALGGGPPYFDVAATRSTASLAVRGPFFLGSRIAEP